MRLVLVRHGETPWNREGRLQGHNGVGLSPLGVMQARAVAEALRFLGARALYSSSLLRALETAQLISQAISLPITSVDGLREMGLGKVEGLTAQEMQAQYPELHQRWREDPAQVTMPEGESLPLLQQRTWTTVTQLTESHPSDVVVAVSHGLAISSILCRLLEVPLSRFRQLQVELGSITILELQGERGRVVTLNDRCHLNSHQAASSL